MPQKGKLLLCFFFVGLLVIVGGGSVRTRKKKEKSYYEKLELPPTATAREIKKAYFQLARQYHPDKTSELNREQAEEKFIEIAQAYEILSDPKKKERYDKLLLLGQTVYHEVDEDKVDRDSHLFNDDPQQQQFQDASETFKDFVDNIEKDKDFSFIVDEKANTTVTIAFGFVLLVVLGAISFAFFSQQQRNREEEQKKKQQQQKRDEESKKHQEVERKKELKKKEQEQKQQQRMALWEKQQQLMAKQRGEQIHEEEDLQTIQEKIDQDIAQSSKQQKSQKKEQQLYCAACKKVFKSDQQWKNHERSRKHKINVSQHLPQEEEMNSGEDQEVEANEGDQQETIEEQEDQAEQEQEEVELEAELEPELELEPEPVKTKKKNKQKRK